VGLPDLPLAKPSRRGDKMLTPIVIQILFWVGVVACILGGIGILAVVFGPPVMRIYCEWLIVLFRINDTLTDIRRNTERGK